MGAGYSSIVPKLWSDTIETHRQEVAGAVLDAATALVEKLGMRQLTMSAVAERAGIGRATLYKYFGDVDAILLALQERHVDAALAELMALGTGPGSPFTRLAAVLDRYALLRQGHHGTGIEAVLLGSSYVAQAHERLHGLLRDLLLEAQGAGEVRDDVPASELATYCLHALATAGHLSSRAATKRLVAVMLAGMESTPVERVTG
jgi:AcrR family transcriptional regulator